MLIRPGGHIPCIAAALLLGGCHLIFPFEGSEPGAGDAAPRDGGTVDVGADTDGLDRLDAPRDGDGAPPPDGTLTGDATACPPVQKVVTQSSSAGDWTLALGSGYTYQDLLPPGLGTGEAVAIFDLQDQVSGFVVSLSAAGGASSEAKDLEAKVRALGAPARLLRSGQATTTHDGHAAVIGAWFDVQVATAVTPSALRKILLAQVLPKANGWIPDQPYGGSALRHVVAYQVVVRQADKRQLLLVAVAERSKALALGQGVGLELADLTGGTALAAKGKQLLSRCESFKLTYPKPKLDLIWISDESASMTYHLAKIKTEASTIFNTINRYQLDARMGVTSVVNPGGGQPGKLCSKATTDSYDDGGTDRFLTSSEQATFISCVQNPPYYEGGTEYGLAAALESLTRHLPRKAADTAKIRTGAVTAVLLLSDEVPNELLNGASYNGQAGMLDYADAVACSLAGAKQNSLAAYIAPWLALYQGKDPTFGADGEARFFVLAPHCSYDATCNGNHPWGYQELAAGSQGAVGSLCPAELTPSLNLFLHQLAGWASPLKLKGRPVSGSLAAELSGTKLPRSWQKGFAHQPLDNALVLAATPYSGGGELVVSFNAWK